MQRQKASPYASLIAAATGAPERRLALLENLMRDEIFHSTLDWQSAEELAAGARRAHDLYRSTPAYYEGLLILQRSEFRLAQLEGRLREVSESGDTGKTADLETRVQLARESVRIAREAIPRLAAFHELP
ncbi:hypothetical protein [Haloferula sp.]|uniref:hypothetical protein n=1 Tax=Haloferula sp. TaxID=2497595 RepID=UPI003C7956EC